MVLAIQDTTGVQFGSHKLKSYFEGEKGTPHGFMVHTVLAVDPKTGSAVGILDQNRWIRHPKREKDPQAKKQLKPCEKESIKWEEGLDACHRLFNNCSTRVITVADRGSDIYDFIHYATITNSPIILRSRWDREGRSEGDKKSKYVHDCVRNSPVICCREITVGQRGAQENKNGQKARPSRPKKTVTTEIRVSMTMKKRT